jgi:transcriptional regulator with XRE-family HTH domain
VRFFPLLNKKSEPVLLGAKKYAKGEKSQQLDRWMNSTPRTVRRGGSLIMAEKNFGRVIEDRRHELGLTQETVAKKVGVKANYIGYLERGMRHPSQKVVERLSSALKIDPQDLYLLANPRVRSLLGKAKTSGPAGPSLWQKFLRDSAQQQKQGLSSREQEALSQLSQGDKTMSMAGVVKIIKALRKGFGA